MPISRPATFAAVLATAALAHTAAAVAQTSTAAPSPRAAEAAPSAAKPVSWVVRRGKSEVWLFPSGLSASGNDIPLDLRNALATAVEVWFETPAAGDSAAVQRFVAENGIDEKADLFSQLSQDEAARLETLIQRQTLDRGKFVHAKPWWAYLQLNSLQGGLLSKSGTVNVESNLKRQVSGSSSRIRSEFASTLELLEWFAALSTASQFCGLGWQVERIEQFKPETEAIVRAWSSGDMDYFNASMGSLDRRCPDLKRAMVDERNKAWVPRIKEMLREPGLHVVVIGAGHLTTDRYGVQSLLRTEGIEALRR